MLNNARDEREWADKHGPKIDDFLDAAREIHDIPSDRELASRLNVAPTAVNHWRKGRAWPSDTAMIRLADLSGEEPTEALLWLNYWRSPNPAKIWYLRMLDAVQDYAVSIVAIFVFSLLFVYPLETKAAQVTTVGPNTLYYGKFLHFR